MPLSPKYSSADDVPETLRDFYAQQEGSDDFILQVEATGGFALEDVAGLKSTLGKLKDRVAKSDDALKGYTALDKSSSELQGLLSELATLQESQGSESDAVAAVRLEMDNLKRSAKSELEKAIAPITELSNTRLDQLKSLLIDAKLREAIIAEGGSPKLLMPVLKNEVRARTDDSGNVIVEIIDAEGTPRVTGADLNPMGFDDLVRERKQDDELAVAFSANGHSGGGTKADTTTNGSTNTRQLTPEQAGALTMDEYRKAKDEGLIPA
jgi:hypothetical protein